MAAFSDEPKDNPATIVGAALDIIADHISEGEMDDVKASLPKEIRDLWY